MATMKLETLDVLDEECRQLCKKGEFLEWLYYTCGTVQLAIEHLLRPNNPTGVDYKSITAQMRSMKDILDKHMQMFRLISVNVVKGTQRLQTLKDIDDPEMAEEVNRLRDILLDFCQELRSLIKQGASLCRRYHIACKIVLDYLIKCYCES